MGEHEETKVQDEQAADQTNAEDQKVPADEEIAEGGEEEAAADVVS